MGGCLRPAQVKILIINIIYSHEYNGYYSGILIYVLSSFFTIGIKFLKHCYGLFDRKVI